MTEEKTKAKAPAKAKRPRLTAEQKIEQLKEQAVALEAKVKERKLASFSKDLESYTKLVKQLDTIYTKARELYDQLATTKAENEITEWIPDPWMEDTEDKQTVSLFDDRSVLHLALTRAPLPSASDEAKAEAGE